jgi:hypothetical protein
MQNIGPVRVLDLKPNTDEWLEERLNRYCASEAPVIMGASPHMTRDELLDIKKGWQASQDNSFKERLFQDGHDAEDEARPIIEAKYYSFFPATVIARNVNGLELLASLDGLESGMIGGRHWEHKLFNRTLYDNVVNGVLEDFHIWQLEHQCLVNGRSDCLFTCSDGTREKSATMIYNSNPEKRAELVTAWKVFDADLEKHQIKAKKEEVVAEEVNLPVFHVDVNGGQIVTNADLYIKTLKEIAEKETSKILKTEYDFAAKEKLVSEITTTRKKLKEKAAEVQGKFVSFNEFVGHVKEMDDLLRMIEKDGETQIKNRKEEIKGEIRDEAQVKLNAFISEVNERLAPNQIQNIIQINTDFHTAMKNKRKLDSLRQSVNQVVADAKKVINSAMEKIEPNLNYIREYGQNHRFLFKDINQHLTQDTEAFSALVDTRISKFEEERKKQEDEKAAEEKRLQEEAEEKRRLEANETVEKPAKDMNSDLLNEAHEQVKKDRVSGTANIGVDMASGKDTSVSGFMQEGQHIPVEEVIATTDETTVLQTTGFDVGVDTGPVSHINNINLFESWWYDTGSKIYPAIGEDPESHAKRVALAAYDACLVHNNLD